MLSQQLNCESTDCHQPVVTQVGLSDRKAAGGATEIMCSLLSIVMYAPDIHPQAPRNYSP